MLSIRFRTETGRSLTGNLRVASAYRNTVYDSLHQPREQEHPCRVP